MLGVTEDGIRKGAVLVGSEKKVQFHSYTEGKTEMAFKDDFCMSVLLRESFL